MYVEMDVEKNQRDEESKTYLLFGFFILVCLGIILSPRFKEGDQGARAESERKQVVAETEHK